ncbi:MAG: DUF445 domain-containing protein [Pseudomonadota bacterium]
MDASTLEILKYCSIPIVAALVGWGTNWVAIKLTFWPVNFIGLRPWLGWQGIIPSKSRKMAGISVDNILSKLGSLSEVVEYMDPRHIAQHIVDVIEPQIEAFTEEAMLRERRVLWENLPVSVKNQINERVRRELPKLVDRLVDEVGGNIEDLLDLKDMIQDQLGEDKGLMNRIFLDCGEKEFRFIINSGIYFGFAFGIVQAAVWYFYPQWWILPLFGLMVGYATNWIALNIIFRPLYPVNILGFKFQGIFLSRQHEVSEVYTEIVTDEILTIRHLVHRLLTGPKSDRVHALIRKHIKGIVDESAGIARLFVQSAIGPESYANIKEWVGDKAIVVSPEPFEDSAFVKDRGHRVREMMRERMEDLTAEEFQNMLRPAFQEDEMKLILAGAILGLGAGFMQLIFVFGGF